MKVLTIFGTRPEIIRLSRIMPLLDANCEHVTVHTGQNYHEGLSGIFLNELGVRDPDFHMGVRSASFGEQAGKILALAEEIIAEQAPDKVLVLGDTNSALAAVVAARRGIPVFHMEAGNRCYDNRVPEEINRRIIDHSSSVLLPYTTRSKENLVREGIERERIFVTGNPINEVLRHNKGAIDSSPVVSALGVQPKNYILVTLHRAENVDVPERLKSIFEGFDKAASEFGRQLLVSVHPRTADRLKSFGINPSSEDVRLLDPLGFFDFVKLERDSLGVYTDSGTVQEECAIFGIPNVTVRDVTERPETIECGSNILSGADPDSIVSAMNLALSREGTWSAPEEYLTPVVSEKVANIVLGHTLVRSYH